MADPANKDEYLALFNENTVIEGFGLDVTMRQPCPFCASPDFLALRPTDGILNDAPNIDAQMSADTTCESCGRSAKAIVKRDENGVSFEVVQTGGDDPPEWLTPPMRRVP